MSLINGSNQIDFTGAPLAGASAVGLDLTGATGVPATFANNFSATVDPAVTDDSGSSYDPGSLWYNTLTGELFQCVDSTVGAAVWKSITSGTSGNLNNLTATVDPAVTDDSGSGYIAGSLWYNQTSNSMFVCEDAAVGAAVWESISASTVVNLVTQTTYTFATAPTVTDDVNSGYLVGDTWTDTATGNIYYLVDNTAGAAEWILTGNTANAGTSVPLSNVGATTAPTATDDSSKGYTVGSVWVDSATGNVYVLVDDTSGSAVWKNVSYSGSSNLLVSNFTFSVIGGSVATYTQDIDITASIGAITGLAFDGTDYWISASSNTTIYKFDTSFVYSGTSFSVLGQMTAGRNRGIAYVGGNLHVADGTNRIVYVYTTAGTYTGTSYDISANTSYIQSLDTDGTYIYAGNTIDGNVYKFDTSYTFQSVINTSTEDSQTYSASTDGVYIWTVGTTNNRLYRYTMAGIYDGYFLDISPEIVNASAENLIINQGKIYTTESTPSARIIHEYSLSGGVEYGIVDNNANGILGSMVSPASLISVVNSTSNDGIYTVDTVVSANEVTVLGSVSSGTSNAQISA